MNNSKKIILMCLIPAVLTIFFIVQFTVPAVIQYFNLRDQIKQHKTDIESTKANIVTLKANKKLANQLDILNKKLIGFDVEFPSKFRDEIFLIDLEVFANQAVNRIVELSSFNEKPVEIIDPAKKQVKSKRRRRQQQEEILPVQIVEKPFDINTVAYYNEIIDFVDFLESYQRKINIQGISAKIFQDDNENPNPRIEMKISGSTYISKVNETEKNENLENAKSKK